MRLYEPLYLAQVEADWDDDKNEGDDNNDNVGSTTFL